MAVRGNIFSDRTVAVLRDIIRWWQSGPHGGDTSTPGQRRERHHRATGRLFQIVSSVQDGSVFRWVYTATEVRITGEFEYEVINEDVTVTIINTVEIDNTSSTSGIQSGIQLDPGGITAIEELPDDMIVCSDTYRVDSEGVGRWYVTYPNAPVGCVTE
jgi:hypothetical protein